MLGRQLSFFTLLLSIAYTGITGASQKAQALELYDARTLQTGFQTKVSLENFTAKIKKGSILVIGEQHNLKGIQQGQLDLLNDLRNRGHSINVGLEFLKYSDQAKVDAYRKGTLSEAEFKATCWGESDFDVYRDQILFPSAKNDERTFAINSPKNLPLAVKNKGLANLTDEERALLPPQFQLGRSSYKERFIERMKGHVSSDEAMNRYFETQSVWDDTMAWKACEAAALSNHTLVLVVGQFHVEYEDGLIDRIRARCGQSHPLTSVFQYLFYNDEEVNFNSFIPSPKYGAISDFLMIVHPAL